MRSGNGSCIASVHVHQARTCVLIPGVPEAEASARAELEGVVINRVHPRRTVLFVEAAAVQPRVVACIRPAWQRAAVLRGVVLRVAGRFAVSAIFVHVRDAITSCVGVGCPK